MEGIIGFTGHAGDGIAHDTSGSFTAVIKGGLSGSLGSGGGISFTSEAAAFGAIMTWLVDWRKSSIWALARCDFSDS